MHIQQIPNPDVFSTINKEFPETKTTEIKVG